MGWLGAMLFLFPVLAVIGSDRDLFDEGERRFAAGNYVLAIDRFERLLQDHPGSEYGTRAQFRIAQSRFYLEEYPAALERLQRTAARARGGALSRAIRLWIGLTEFQLGGYQRADDALTRYLVEEPSPEGRAFLYRGLARQELGRTIAAIEDLVTATGTTEGVERSYAVTVLMEIYSERGSHADTLTLYDRWASSDDEAGSYEEAQVRYAADAAYELDDIERAVTLYRRLVDYSLASAQWAYRRLYAIAQDRQDREEMQTVFRAAERRLASEPERLADFWYSLGADAFDSGRDELAELYLSRVWDVRRQRMISGAAPFLLARSMERQGREGEALRLLLDSLEDTAVESDFGSERRVAAGRLLIADGRFAEAAALLEGRDELETDSAALYIWGFALYRAGERERVEARLERDESQALIRERPALALLRARLFLERGDAIAAVRTYRTYLAERPDDDRARVELVRALVGAAQFASASQEVDRIDSSALDAVMREELVYLRGLADFHEGAFETAVASLRSVTDSRYEPFRSYHLAWSLYRLGEARAARDTIAAVVDNLPPALRFDGTYLYAWTLYQGGDVARAADRLLQLLGDALDAPEEDRVRRLLATVYLEAGNAEDALVQYRILADNALDDRRRGEFLSLLAATLAALGRVNEAILEYDELAGRLPETEAGRLALLEAGEILVGVERYREARERFRTYQSRYPRGEEIDRALYWAGATSYELEEPGRALLWWEPLVNEFPRSSFTPETLFLAAGIYVDRGQRRQALELYDRLTAAYPDSRRAREAERLRRTIRLELDGLSAREAELWVRLQPGPGQGPVQGGELWFELVLELGRIAIREQITLTAQRTRIIDFLLDAARFDGPEAAEATFLLAEYYRRRGETRSAIERYIAAAAVAGAPDELRARSLFELAVLAREEGDSTTAERAIGELRERYGDTIWADRAQRIMESSR